MPEWKHSITQRFEAGTRPCDVATTLAARLRRLPDSFRGQTYGGDTLDELIEWLDGETDPTADREGVDSILRMIYDWGDANRLWLDLRFD